MKDQILEIKVALQIQKPAGEVFEVIVDPAKMSGYFISKGSGRLEEGKQVIWKFPEFDMEFPVKTGKIIPDKYISFYWDSDGKELMVEINLLVRKDGSTLVNVT